MATFIDQCLTLRSVKYSDSNSIVTAWGRQSGRLSLIVPSGQGVQARRLRAVMMPLGACEGVISTRPGREVARISGVRPLAASPAALGHPVKSALAMFMADFLFQTLKESAPDPLLADYLFEQVRALTGAPEASLANFHISFAFRLGRFLGIEPDMGSYAPGAYFDIKEGRFCASAPAHTLYLPPEQAEMVRTLFRLRPRSLSLLRLSRADRAAVLDRIIQYYTLHHAPIANLPSLPILRDLFS